MFLRTGVLAMLIAGAAMPLFAATRAQVTIGTPVILVDALDPDPAAAPAFTVGGTRVEDFNYYLSPAPVSPEAVGQAFITHDSEQSIGGRTEGPDSQFIVVGDRYAPSFTFTSPGRTRVTVEGALHAGKRDRGASRSIRTTSPARRPASSWWWWRSTTSRSMEPATSSTTCSRWRPIPPRSCRRWTTR
jgi:hypothetical protein